jgi:hypothetical protein
MFLVVDDDLGRVKQASLPYFEDEQRYFVTTEYDAIGRLISTTKPAGATCCCGHLVNNPCVALVGISFVAL